MAALATGALITGSTPFPWGSARSSAEAASGPTREAQALERSEAAALLQLYAAQSSLTRAKNELAALEARAAELARAERSALRQADVVQRSLAASQRRVAVLLRDLYVQGAPDPIAVLLGATSLDEAMAGIEGLSRATAMNARLGSEAKARAHRLELARQQLARERRGLDSARSAARSGADRLAAAVAAQRRTLSSVRRRQALSAQRLAALQSRARAAEERSAKLTSPARSNNQQVTSSTATPQPVTTTDAQPAPPVTPGGDRTLAVDAVAYHLPGTTASGLPVGVGVVAVDPSVIPLGTRLFVPGYGPAVAADVGSAIKGNIIDLWMPSTAAARAWGRRTVTITVYG